LNREFPVPPGPGFLEAFGIALRHAAQWNRDIYLYQNDGGHWIVGSNPPAEDPYLMVNSVGEVYVGCEHCEGEREKRYSLKGE
jgi:hypothetical protein